MKKKKIIGKYWSRFGLTCTFILLGQSLKAQLSNLEKEFDPSLYDVVWNSPSLNAKESMPLGNGDLGANIWVESNGDIRLIVAKTDAFDEFNRLLKLGEIRIRTKPALLQEEKNFVQALRLKNGLIEIKTPKASFKIWIDACHPTMEVEMKASIPLQAEIHLENWRKQSRLLTQVEKQSAYGNWPDKFKVNADSIFHYGNHYLASCHHNIESQWKTNLELTGLGEEVKRNADPILNRTFGLMVFSKSMKAISDTILATSTPTRSLKLQVIAHTQIVPNCSIWLQQTKTLQAKLVNARKRFKAHFNYWQQFWDKSWIEVTDSISQGSPAKRVTEAYVLQRFMNAAAGRGPLPFKFNGSIFSVEGYDPDFRLWGGAYWWQNTRLPYWSMLYSGDYDLMKPLFAMYWNALPLRQAATRKYYNHEGAFFPETMYFWGNYNDENYGIDRKGKPEGLTDNTYIRRYWQGGIELTDMMLDYNAASRSETFAQDTLIPFARAITTFYDQHWSRNENGTIVFNPAQSLETWHEAVNPTPEISGLKFILPRLMELNASVDDKSRWQQLLKSLPSIPTANQNGETYILPAQEYSKKSNIENCELYAVFPYRLYTCLNEDSCLQTGLNTWKRRLHKEDYGWQQNSFQAALLGLAQEAQQMLINRATRIASGYRFPGFFGPNYDWTPDQDHPSGLMIGLQRMLMQCEGDRIVLTPAWPQNWNARFKLHAPKNTVIEAVVENGKTKILKVIPESRQKDIVILPLQPSFAQNDK